MDTSISLGVGGYFLIRSSSFMDWFYYAYGDTLHGLVPRIYRHSKGNVSLSTSILPINLILQVVLLPIYLLLFAGSIETIPLPTLIESILIVLIFPFVLAHLTRFLLRRKEPVLSNIVIPFSAMLRFSFYHLRLWQCLLPKAHTCLTIWKSFIS